MSDAPVRLTYDQIERMLHRRASASDAGLLDEILAAVEATPQRRAWLVAAPSRRVVVLMAAALLLAALAGALAVGAGIIRGGLPGMVVGLTECGIMAVDPETGTDRDLVSPVPGCQIPVGFAWATEARVMVYALYQWDPANQTPDGGIWMFDPATGDSRQVIRCPLCFDTAISPDGARIAFTEDSLVPGHGLVKFVDATGALIRSVDFGRWAGEIRFSPDGQQVALAADPDAVNQLYVLDVDGGDPRSIFERSGLHIFGASWSPDGEQLAVTTLDIQARDVGVWVVGADGSNARHVASADSPIAQQLAEWSPDGSHIAYARRYAAQGGEGFEVWVVQPDGESQVRVYDSCCNDAGTAPVWAPDGSALAFVVGQAAGYQPESWGLYVVRPDGSDLRRVREFLGAAIAWFPLAK